MQADNESEGGNRSDTGSGGRHTVEEANTAAGHGNIKVVVSKITARVGRLDNHLLARNGARREGQLIAGTAPLSLVAALDVDGGPSIRHRLVDSPRALVRAHVRAATAVATRPRVSAIVQGVVVPVARKEWLRAVTLEGPCA